MLQGKIIGVEKKHLVIGVISVFVLYYLSKSDGFKVVAKKMTAKANAAKGIMQNAKTAKMNTKKNSLTKGY